MREILRIVIQPNGELVGYCSDGYEWRDGQTYDRRRPPLAQSFGVYFFDGRETHDWTDRFRRPSPIHTNTPTAAKPIA